MDGDRRAERTLETFVAPDQVAEIEEQDAAGEGLASPATIFVDSVVERGSPGPGDPEFLISSRS